jgi:hypothetical protein
MVLFSALACLAFYILLAVGFVAFVKNSTDEKFYKWLAVAFVILLPTWDIIIGLIVYPVASSFIPKMAIYETAETDGIYYEGEDRNRIFEYEHDDSIHVSFANVDLDRGYKYVENLVTTKGVTWDMDNYKNITPVLYRCIPCPPRRPNNYLPEKCMPVSDIKSPYLVKIRKVKIGITAIFFIKIRNRSTGKLMAEYNEVVLGGKKYFLSFQSFLDGWQPNPSDGIAHKKLFYEFPYKVLKLRTTDETLNP